MICATAQRSARPLPMPPRSIGSVPMRTRRCVASNCGCQGDRTGAGRRLAPRSRRRPLRTARERSYPSRCRVVEHPRVEPAAGQVVRPVRREQAPRSSSGPTAHQPSPDALARIRSLVGIEAGALPFDVAEDRDDLLERPRSHVRTGRDADVDVGRHAPEGVLPVRRVHRLSLHDRRRRGPGRRVIGPPSPTPWSWSGPAEAVAAAEGAAEAVGRQRPAVRRTDRRPGAQPAG